MSKAHGYPEFAVHCSVEPSTAKEGGVRNLRHQEDYFYPDGRKKRTKMSFLNLIRHEMCHPEHVTLQPGPLLVCSLCSKSVNAYEFILAPSPDHYRSSRLAQAYYEQTGDDQVRLNFPVVHLQGIMDETAQDQTLHRVHRSIRMLNDLNSPFSAAARSEEDYASFLSDFLHIMYEHPLEGNERVVLQALIKSMHDLLSSKEVSNPFETYFDVLVPYVQRCTDWLPLKGEPMEGGPAELLLWQLHRSHEIRRVFGRYALPFDLIHVMVACYACSSDMRLVANWALDFLVRICKGHFFRVESQPFARAVSDLIASEVSYKKNTPFYQVLKVIRQGESMQHYSTFMQPFHEAQSYLRDKFGKKYKDSIPDALMDVAFAQNFPAVLFSDYRDQLGFMLGHNHVLMTLHKNRGQLPKGTYKTARHIHETVLRIVAKVLEFETMPMEWTMSTLELFMQMEDNNVEKEIMDVVRMIMSEE